jgi:prepilin-type N-terminal cleavage/methylation domain-containing protein
MKKNGFSLIEIMVAIGIIGLLAVLGTLTIRKGIRDSYIKQATAELNMISASIRQLAWDTGRWPNGEYRTQGGSVEEWDISTDSCGLWGNDETYSDWKGPYYGGEIEDPWGNNYFFDPDYRIDGINHIVVGSFGPNGQGQNLYDTDDVYVLLDD